MAFEGVRNFDEPEGIERMEDFPIDDRVGGPGKHAGYGWTEFSCQASGPDYSTCLRPKGHTGPHASHKYRKDGPALNKNEHLRVFKTWFGGRV